MGGAIVVILYTPEYEVLRIMLHKVEGGLGRVGLAFKQTFRGPNGSKTLQNNRESRHSLAGAC